MLAECLCFCCWGEMGAGYSWVRMFLRACCCLTQRLDPASLRKTNLPDQKPAAVNQQVLAGCVSADVRTDNG